MLADKKDKEESQPNKETRELFLDATTDDLGSTGLCDADNSETESEQTNGKSSDGR